MDSSQLSRNLSMELVRVTEKAALSAYQFMGRDDKISADQAAVDGMRHMLNKIDMKATVVIGEGEKDEAPMLYNGEILGMAEQPEVDLAVDPIDGTTPLAKGRENSIATLAIAPRNTMFQPGPFVYMEKLAVGPKCKGLVNINKSVTENLKIISDALNKRPEDVTVVVLDRSRHEELINEIREFGARVRLILDGDVIGALVTSWPDTGIDAMMGIGGTPEGVLAACALRALGGDMQGRLYARNDDERQEAINLSIDVEKVLILDDLVSSDDVYFAATGITDGTILQGVQNDGNRASTDSLIIRGKSGSVRQIRTTHNLDFQG